jgi:glutathione S-transferase
MAEKSRPYLLYWYKAASSLAPMAVLEETGVAYEAVEVDAAADAHKDPAYREIHPLGLIPALRLPDGRTVFESAGIVMFLADRHPEAGIAPAPTSAERAFYNQWLFYLADTLYPSYNRYYWSTRFSTEAADGARIKARSAELLVDQWAVVERALLGRDWLVGESCSAADIYLQMITTWEAEPAAFRARCPNVARVAEATAARPGVARALSRHVVLGA